MDVGLPMGEVGFLLPPLDINLLCYVFTSLVWILNSYWFFFSLSLSWLEGAAAI